MSHLYCCQSQSILAFAVTTERADSCEALLCTSPMLEVSVIHATASGCGRQGSGQHLLHFLSQHRVTAQVAPHISTFWHEGVHLAKSGSHLTTPTLIPIYHQYLTHCYFGTFPSQA